MSLWDVFLSPGLVEQVVENRVSLKRGGDERRVTIMFADIRGFTSLTERSRAGDVVDLLNDYFDQMVEVIFNHEGALDKFIGDALMAVWGTPVSSEDDAARAIAAARDMLESLQSFNSVRADQALEPIRVGIGLASGVCVAGAIGARRRMEYTVIGDAVNLASRLADVARGGEIVCDEETFILGGRPSDADKQAGPAGEGQRQTCYDLPHQLFRKQPTRPVKTQGSRRAIA